MNRGMAKLCAVGTATLFATGIVVGCGGNSGTDSNQVTITYWQYTFPSKVTEMKKLIQAFEKQNPDIKVVEQDFPYDQYNQKVTAAMHAGKGPDVLNLYYGWIPQYVKQGYLQPIPQDFMSTVDIKNYYIPMVQTSAVDGKYYALPTAVRTLALFYNKDLFQKAGLDPNKPPTTWDELIQDAKKMTITNSNGQFQQEGFAWDVSGQGYHTFEEILLRQFGVTPFSEDGKQVLWDSSPNGLAAFQYWTDMETQDKIGSDSFLSAYNTAFEAGKAGMMIDGSFDIAAVKKAAKFDWGVTTIPVLKPGGVQSNFGSFWVNGIAKGVTGKKLEASEKFLKFLISEDTEKDWLQNVGELPAAKSLSNDSSIVSDPIYGPFVKGLQSAHATFFVNETQERQDMIDAVSKINLQHADVKQTFANLVKQEQTIRDQYFNKP
jgi:multiple sugar transport system substrate-binding protein